MTTIVKLKAQFTGLGGGTAYAGEMIGVDADTAANLIRSGAAVAVNKKVARPTPDPMPTTDGFGGVIATKPITDTPALKGPAKLSWLRAEIRKRGAEPEGRTIAAMTEQLRKL